MPSLNEFLRTVSSGDNLRDFAHASRLFVDGVYQLSPKRPFLFHTVFHLNHKPISYRYNSVKEIELSMLVKNVALPTFSPTVETKNRYNRKTNIQTAMVYNPVQITFHDDKANVVRDLWKAYFKYYYNDIKHEGFDYRNEPYEAHPRSNRWGFDRFNIGENRKAFLSKIDIFSLNQRKYAKYTLINPIITDFSHGQHDYSDNGSLEHQMTVNYETVLYSEGFVNSNNVRGFASVHYDRRPSPLSIAGGGTFSVFGPGGFLQAGSEILADLNTGNIFGAIFKSFNIYENLRDANLKAIIKSEGRTIFRDIIKTAGQKRLTDFSFPVLVDDNISRTNATQITSKIGIIP